jgi:Zn-dependent protease with chaperone function
MAILPWATFDGSDISARLRKDHAANAATTVLAGERAVKIPEAQNPPGGLSFQQATEVRAPLPPPVATERASPRYLPVLVVLWLAGVVVFSGRFCMRWVRLRRLMSGPLIGLMPEWKERFEGLLRKAGIRKPVRLGESAGTVVPIVAGWRKPVILLPLGTLVNLPADQIEAIILHELAHVARGDYLVNLLQGVMETLFFYHPAVWSVSGRIRRERELACDDLAVKWCGEPCTYAEALAGFEEYRAHAPMLAATGEGDLLRRIRRVLGGGLPERRGAGMPGMAGLAGLSCIALYLASMFTAPALVTAAERTARQIQRSGPTGVVIIDEKSGEPIAGADIELAARQVEGAGLITRYKPGKEILGHTDQAGRLKLSTFTANYDYAIYVRAKGHPVTAFSIEPGDGNRVCEMPAGVHVRGKILDPNGVLSGRGIERPVKLRAAYYVDNNLSTEGFEISDERRLPEGEKEISFSFENLRSEGVWLDFRNSGLENYQFNIENKGDVDGYVIDLSKKRVDGREEIRKLPKRTVEVTIETTDGGRPSGNMEGNYVAAFPPVVAKTGTDGVVSFTGSGYSEYDRLAAAPIINGKAAVEVPVWSLLMVRAEASMGYEFEQGDFQVPAGEGVYKRTVRAEPAGEMHGKVRLTAGAKSKKLEVTYATLKEPAGTPEKEPYYIGGEKMAADGHYILGPLPYGGTYATVVQDGHTFYVSERAKIDAEHRRVEQSITVGGTNGVLQGKCVDTTGAPIAYTELMLVYHVTPENYFLCDAATTGKDGSFEIDGMNYEVPGNYEVKVIGPEWGDSMERIDGGTKQPVVIAVKRRSAAANAGTTGTAGSIK